MSPNQRFIFTKHFQFVLCGLLAFIILDACGGGGSGETVNEGAGSLTFQVQWDREKLIDDAFVRAAMDDCADVATVSAAVYDTEGELLQTGGPWECSAGGGTITQVPANRYVRPTVVGYAANGLVRYRGEAGSSFFLPSGGSVNAGVIVASPFRATLTAPGDGEVLAPDALILSWSVVSGADYYVVEIADNASFSQDHIVRTEVIDPSSTPLWQPDIAGIEEETAYFWRVQVVDTEGNPGEPSSTRQFSISRNLLSVAISEPLSESTFQMGDVIPFEGSAAYPDNSMVSTGDLAVIQWSSDRDGDLGNTLAFESDALSGGTHVITLYLEDGDGLFGSMTTHIFVNQPPVADIVSPEEDFRLRLDIEKDYDGVLTCQGTGTDPDQGVLDGASIQWRLFGPNDPDNPILIGEGAAFDISYGFFWDGGPGGYTLVMAVTDANGATTSQARSFEFNYINHAPTAQILVPAVGYILVYDWDDPNFIDGTMTCEGAGSDPEDGALGGSSLSWELFSPDNSLTPRLTGSGSTFGIPHSVIADQAITGYIWTISLRATDSVGASVTVTRQFEFNWE